ncbi:hypothetical protein D3C87_1963670 [compost metagenome]
MPQIAGDQEEREPVTSPTPKPFKALQLIGVLLLIVAVVARISTGSHYWTGAALLGLLLYALGRVLAWWKNG